MALKIDIAANTRQAQSQVKDLGEALDDTADSLDDLARSGDKAADKLERSFRDIVKDAQKADKAVEGIGKSGGKSFGKAGEAAGEFKQEALSNFSEVTSSFDGSMSSIQDLAQGTLGGLASTGLPGVGIAAGIAATAIGAIGAGFQAAEEKRAVLEERANDLANAYIDAGGKVLDALTVADRTADILTDPSRKQELQELTDLLGGDMSLAVRALAGDTEALVEVQTRAAAAQERNNELSTQQSANTGKRKTEIGEEVDANERLIEKTAELTQIQEDAALKAQVQSDVLISLINSTEGATVETDNLGNALYTLPDGKQILVKADTKQATTNIGDFKGDVDGVPEEVTTKVKVTVDDSQWRNWTPIQKHGQVLVNVPGSRAWQ